MTEYNQIALNIRRTMIRSAFIAGEEGQLEENIPSVTDTYLGFSSTSDRNTHFCLPPFCEILFFFSTARVKEEGNRESKLFPEHPLSLKSSNFSLQTFIG